jgi:zinc and cadmium transporter
MSLLAWIIVFTLIGGVLSVVCAALLLLVPEDHHPRILPHGVSFALGALLSVAFLDLLPDALTTAGSEHIKSLLATVLMGILGFFLLEKLLIWRHCHADHCETHSGDHFHQPAGTLIVVGDAIHNFVDGILLAAAFLTDINLGIITSLAVAAHEIPQEVGDFAILLQSGYGRGKALAYNLLSSLATMVGGILAYYSLEHIHGWLPYILALAASSFIYIAVADLIPSLHQKTTARAAFQQIALIVAGVLVIYWAHAQAEIAGHPEEPTSRSILPPPGAH